MMGSMYPECGNFSENFFEGTEKLLEIWFSRTEDSKSNDCDLRSIPRPKLEKMLELVHCEVISFSRNESIDAYVLSESSMFVSKNRFIIKTCGTTTLLNCLKTLVYLVKKYTKYDNVQDVFYSRRKFAHPELQPSPHTSFEEETRILSEMFKNGAAYCLGRMNQDCWYLFTTDSFFCNKMKYQQQDQTFEMIMTDLDPDIMKIFTKEVSSNSKEATKRAGIDLLLPNVLIDDFLFSPCGYSMNGIMKDGSYMTIHITPESNCSYVSFETNARLPSYKDLIAQLIETFRPGKFITTLFANEDSVLINTQSDIRNSGAFSGFLKQDFQFCHFKNYDLIYALYTKFPS